MKRIVFLAVVAVCAVMAGTALAGSKTPATGWHVGYYNADQLSNAQASPISRAQAVRKAREYLQYQAFSLKGLVSQLKYEGFSTSDATYGAGHSGANWWKQAAAKAKEYLQGQAFSRSGLVAQLKYEGFTSSQALYGARAAGL